MDTLTKTLREKTLVAIEGEPASGKSTLAAFIGANLDANIVHIDDFYKPISLRDANSFKKGGNNIDFERLMKEVIEKHLKRQTITYQPYNCQTNAFEPVVKKPYKPLLVIEGSYSLHKSIAHFADYKILLEVSSALQLKRLKERRNFSDFKTRWIPLSKRFIKEHHIHQIADKTIKDIEIL